MSSRKEKESNTQCTTMPVAGTGPPSMCSSCCVSPHDQWCNLPHLRSLQSAPCHAPHTTQLQPKACGVAHNPMQAHHCWASLLAHTACIATEAQRTHTATNAPQLQVQPGMSSLLWHDAVQYIVLPAVHDNGAWQIQIRSNSMLHQRQSMAAAAVAAVTPAADR